MKQPRQHRAHALQAESDADGLGAEFDQLQRAILPGAEVMRIERDRQKSDGPAGDVADQIQRGGLQHSADFGLLRGFIALNQTGIPDNIRFES